MPGARWNLIVSHDTDEAVRQVLAEEGRARKGELSRFVEDAVCARIREIRGERHAVSATAGEPAVAAFDGGRPLSRTRRRSAAP